MNVLDFKLASSFDSDSSDDEEEISDSSTESSGSWTFVRMMHALMTNELTKEQLQHHWTVNHDIDDVFDGQYATLLCECCRFDSPDVVRVLLESKANPNINLKEQPPFLSQGPVTPLDYAARNGNADVVLALLEAKAIVNTHSELTSPLLRASLKGSSQAVLRILLENGANVHDRIPSVRFSLGKAHRMDFTALHCALMNKTNTTTKLDMIKVLLEYKANPNTATTAFGRTPLHVACSQKPVLLEYVQALVEAKGDPCARDHHAHTPLYLAICHARQLSHDDLESSALKYLVEICRTGQSLWVSNAFGQCPIDALIKRVNSTVLQSRAALQQRRAFCANLNAQKM